MKILLINCPIRLDAKPNCIPYGLATIASVLRNQGHDVEIYDINGLRHSEERVIKELSLKKWDLVGVSGLITTYSYQKWLIPELKKINKDAKVISGGGLATSNGDLLFQKTPVDIVVVGEGERSMAELTNAISGKSDVGNVRGIAYRENGEIIKTDPVCNVECLDDIPFPAWDLLPMDKYLPNAIWGDAAANSSGFKEGVKISKSMNIISSRGCPFSCNYCYHLFGRASYRFRSPENIMEEVNVLYEKYQVDFVGFIDDNMMASEKRLLRFCDLLEESGIKISWGCHGRVTSAKPEVLNRMAETGCVWIGYGIESGSQSILDAMNKKATVSQAKDAIINTRNAGIFPNTTFICGYPGENKDTVQETINFKKSLGIECGSFFITPYPGTPVYKKYSHLIGDEERYIESLGNATEFSINLSGLEESELRMLKNSMDDNRDLFEE